MRILHFGRFWSDNTGGIERHVAQLLEQLAARGVDCTNLVASEDGHSGVLDYKGFRIVKAASLGVKFRTAISPDLVLRMRAMHRARPFDLVHAHFPDPMTHLALAFLPREVPRVITWHSDLVPFPALQKLYLPLVARTLRRADAIVAATPTHLRTPQIPADIPPSKLHVIPYGMDFAPFAPTPQTMEQAAALRAAAGGRSVVFALGRHVGYKGFDVLLRAMAQLPQAHLYLGGNGPLRGELEASARSLGIAGRVTFTGRIDDAQLPAYYHACDVFCLPSTGLTEAFGLVQLEAMACGKPVVCTLLGNGVNDIHTDGVTGLAVAPGDAQALAAALRRLIDDPALARQLGEQGRAKAHAGYSLEAMTVPMLALYRSLIDRRQA